MGKSYQIQPITMVRITKTKWEVWERVIRFSPMTMVRLTITRWEVWERVFIFSL